jgi:hypothetical protein
MGIAGFVLVLLFTLGTLVMAIKRRQFVLFIFALIITLNFMVESMLQTSAGVLFFVFFSCFFAKISEQKLKEELSVSANWI